MTRRTTRTVLPAALALTGALLLSACGGSDDGDRPAAGDTTAAALPKLKATGAFVPEPLDRKAAGGFLTVTNSGDAADKLLSATSDVSDDVQIHEVVDNKMRQVDSFDVPANGELKLERGGNHLMFMELKRDLAEGDTVKVELRFEKSAPIKLDVPVRPRTHTAETAEEDGGHDSHGDHGGDSGHDGH
ncbi:copper chaperone PCu(A)C [Streptomyces durbertensis]|uniref:Copper chaperone PCu(A)C n=1 Tax=Streptomyces durbertensis TaxID=2448886 RepID=A0ABR6EAG5_9ACTN|nr:copper chaperone PCu(A)C [Streptomyces durbertensis]MBB1242326.1 copper chaperone PCu(A)C [Streptomyces durbertensis]